MAGDVSELDPPARCPWCSAPLPVSGTARCPTCGASVAEDPATGDLPGVTSVDPEVVRRASEPAPQRRRLFGLLGDLYTVGEAVTIEPSSAAALLPPSREVRLEMARLRAELDAAAAAELAAEQAALEQAVGVEPTVATEQAVDIEPASVESAAAMASRAIRSEEIAAAPDQLDDPEGDQPAPA